MGKGNTLFTKGAQAVGKYIQLPEPIFFCPICLIGYNEKQIDFLTQEHVPQESLGGNIICLTCSGCNSNAGHEIDSHLARRENGVSFFKAVFEKKSYTGRGRINVGESLTNASLKVTEGVLDISADKTFNNPNEHTKLVQALSEYSKQGDWEGQNIGFNLLGDSFNQHRAMVADLKSSYLACFAKFGYKYILHHQLEIVRNQIRKPAVKLIEKFAYRIKPGQLPITRVILIVEAPFKGVAVQIDDRMIFLPPIDPVVAYYDNLEPYLTPDTLLSGFELDFPKTMELALDYK